jgi:hypothetical protein
MAARPWKRSVRGWTSRSTAAFAVRAIAKAGQLGATEEAIAVLVAARSSASPVLKGDIDAALKHLGYKPPATSAPTSPAVAVSEDLYEVLVDAARARKTITYSDAGAVIGLTMRNPHHRRLLGQHLGAISARETEHGRPMLSALVVQKGEKRTGPGFAQLGEELGLKRALDDDRSFDVRELHRVFEYWSKPADRAGTATGAPDFRTRDRNDEPPPAIGPCGFATENGQCLNPGRWDRDGTLSCTTHAIAQQPQPRRA